MAASSAWLRRAAVAAGSSLAGSGDDAAESHGKPGRGPCAAVDGDGLEPVGGLEPASELGWGGAPGERPPGPVGTAIAMLAVSATTAVAVTAAGAAILRTRAARRCLTITASTSTVDGGTLRALHQGR